MTVFERLFGLGHRRAWMPGGRAEFREAMDAVSAFLEGASDDRKSLVLEFAMEVIRNDLKYDLLTKIFYTRGHLPSWGWLPFPVVCYDGNGDRIEVFEGEGKRRMVNLADDCVLVLPWDRGRLRLSIETVGAKGFEFDKTNHRAHYFSPLGICYVSNGKHSIAAGVGHKRGYIEAVEHDVSVLFDHVYTDGRHWYSRHSGDRLGSLYDFRIGVLFELARQKRQVSPA
ncbi:MAG: DUF6710 family protein [Bacillota bacterium]